MNPNKFQACQFLIQYHEQVGHSHQTLCFQPSSYLSAAGTQRQRATRVHLLSPTLPLLTSARPECITISMAIVQAVVHFTEVACIFRSHAYFQNITRGSRHLSGCLCSAQVRGDKIIVFSDNIFSLRNYAVVLKKPFIYGGTSHAERTRVLHAFKHNPQVSHPPAPSSPLHHTSPHASPQCRKPVVTGPGVYDEFAFPL